MGREHCFEGKGTIRKFELLHLCAREHCFEGKDTIRKFELLYLRAREMLLITVLLLDTVELCLRNRTEFDVRDHAAKCNTVDTPFDLTPKVRVGNLLVSIDDGCYFLIEFIEFLARDISHAHGQNRYSRALMEKLGSGSSSGDCSALQKLNCS